MQIDVVQYKPLTLQEKKHRLIKYLSLYCDELHYETKSYHKMKNWYSILRLIFKSL